MLEATARWTTTRVAPTNNAPFAGLGDEASAPSAGGFRSSEGAALVILGLGMFVLWNEIRRPKYSWP